MFPALPHRFASGPLRSGILLVATPHLHDGFFDESVVFIVEHGEDGTFGVILNQPYGIDGEDLGFVDPAVLDGFGPLSEPECFFIGGPVDDATPYVLVGNRHDDEWSINITTQEHHDPLIHRGDYKRVFLGNAGWAPGQLDYEINRGAWMLSLADIDDIFTDEPDLLWYRVLARLGGVFRSATQHPHLN